MLHNGVVKIPGGTIPVFDDCHLLHPLMEPGIGNGHTRGHGKGFDQSLILIGELGRADLVGKVQTPVYLTTHLDPDGEERLHRGMT